MEQQSTRQQKVASQIQRDISSIFLKEAASLIHGTMVTVSAVRVSPDLSFARVYVSVFPFAKANPTLALLKESQAFLRHELGKKVRNQLRIVPELAFQLDDSLERIEHLEKLIK